MEEMEHYLRTYRPYALSWSSENRLSFLEMLIGFLTVDGIRNVQNIASKIKKKKKYLKEPTCTKMELDEDGWFELSQSEELMNWCASTPWDSLIGFIKNIMTTCREDEIQTIKSTFTCEARLGILHPDRVVSRPRPVPIRSGWWSTYSSSAILSLDCEMIAEIIGKKANGGNRCKNKAATVSVCNWDLEVIYEATVYHHPDKVHLTPEARAITGFTKTSFLNGKPLQEIQQELINLLSGKLVIFMEAGSDLNALGIPLDGIEIFDLQTYYRDERGKLGLRDLVWNYYQLDIQSGIHSASTDAMYTMKIFREKYIAEKLRKKEEAHLRGSLELQTGFTRLQKKK